MESGESNTMDSGEANAVIFGDAGDAPSESDNSNAGALSNEDFQSSVDDDSDALLPSIEEQIDAIGFGIFHKRCLLLFCLITSSRGAELTFQHDLRPFRPESDLISDYNMYFLISASLYCAGLLLGGFLADRHGRHSVLLASGVIYILSALCKAIAPDSVMFCVMHFLCELCAGCELPAVMSFAQELVPRAWRSQYAVVLLGSGVFAGYLFVGVINDLAVLVFDMARNLNSWRLLVAMSTIPHIFAIALLWSNTPESPKWLLTKGRKRMSSVLLKSIAEENGSEWQLISDGDIRSGNVVDYDVSCMAVITTSSFLRLCVVCALSLFVSLSCSLFIFLLLPSYSADVPVSTLLDKQAAIPFLQPISIAICLLLQTCVDHRQSLAGAYAFASCVSAGLLLDLWSSGITTGLNLLLICSLFVAFKQTLVLTVESFPTAYRCSCIGICLCSSGIVTAGGYAALRTDILSYPGTCYAVMCLLEMVLALTILFIPRETWLSALKEWPEWSSDSREERCNVAVEDRAGQALAAS